MCNYVESLLCSAMFNDRFHLMYSPRLGTFAPVCQFGRQRDPSGFKQTVVRSDAYGPVGQS